MKVHSLTLTATPTSSSNLFTSGSSTFTSPSNHTKSGSTSPPNNKMAGSTAVFQSIGSDNEGSLHPLDQEDRFSSSTSDSGSSSILSGLDSATLSCNKPFRSFKSSDEYLVAMKEDLADWFNQLYSLELNSDNFITGLETGVTLCRHANNVIQKARESRELGGHVPEYFLTPTSAVNFGSGFRSPFPSSKSTVGSFMTPNSNSHCLMPSSSAICSSLPSSPSHRFGTLGSRRRRDSSADCHSNEVATPFKSYPTSSRVSAALAQFKVQDVGNLSSQPCSLPGFPSSLVNNNNLKNVRHNNYIPSSCPSPQMYKVSFRPNASTGTFHARDNVCNFITWCKSVQVRDCLLFETEDLVLAKNEKQVVLCLLEVARKGSQLGMKVPMLVQLEQEIDQEIIESGLDFGLSLESTPSLTIESRIPKPIPSKILIPSYESSLNSLPDDSQYNSTEETEENDSFPQPQIVTNDLRSLHEHVVDLLNRCTCPSQYPMIKVAEGKYRIGDTKTLIFVRILRSHVMVRVGGGWDTLEHYLDKHDPCRCFHLPAGGRGRRGGCNVRSNR